MWEEDRHMDDSKRMKKVGCSVDEVYFSARSQGLRIVDCLRIIREHLDYCSLVEARDEIERLEPLWHKRKAERALVYILTQRIENEQ
jgi:hypothetical protein